MIPRDAPCSVQHLPLELCYYIPSQHGIGLNRDQVLHYAELLCKLVGQTTDPIVVVRDPEGHYCITNGRHRWIAAHLAGRRTIAAIVVGDDPARMTVCAAETPATDVDIADIAIPLALSVRLADVEQTLKRLPMAMARTDDLVELRDATNAELAALRTRLAALERDHTATVARILTHETIPRAHGG